MEPQRLSFTHSAGRQSPVDVIRLSDLRGRELDHSVFQPTRPSFHLLQLVTEGEGAHWLDFERVDLRGGDVLHVRPEQAHAFDHDSRHEALLLLFTAECLTRLPGLYPARWPESQVLTPRPADFEVLCTLLEAQASLDQEGRDMRPDVVGPHVLATVLTGLAEVVSARFKGVDPKADRYASLVASYERLLSEHGVAQRQLGWYAERLDTTQRTLSRAVRDVRSRSPKELLDGHLIIEAKRRLGTTERTVEAIGFELGFHEATHFVRFFKRVAGVPPDTFRRQLLSRPSQ